MYLKRIDMHGFKSFAEPVSLEFNDGITCIVGPNGSGKSNISDAIRWVLGEQSPKMLRGGKMEEVIFAGTASRKSRGMAEVTIVIDNTTGILPIDYNEVAITRRMYRSGESEYSINNNPCRLRDIRELIMDTGIGVDGYSLIGQGKISDILSNKPESRREIFEEAAGIVLYRTKKAESERKLAAANSNLERVNDIIAEIETRIDGLKEDSEKASEYLELRDRYKALEINITLKNIENVELKNEYLVDDIAETANSIDEIKDEKSEIDKNVTTAREKSEILEKLSSETQDKLLKSIEEVNAIVNRSQLNAEKLSSIERDEKRLSEEIASFSERIEKEENSAKELECTKKEIDRRLKGLEDDLKAKIEKHAEKSSELAKKTEEIDHKKNDLFRLQNAISSKTGEINSLISLKTTLDRRKVQIKAEKQDSEITGKNTRVNLEETAKQREKIKADLAALAAGKEDAKAKYSEAMIKEKQLSTEMEALRLSIGQLSSRKKTIEEMESNYEGYNSAVKFIMKARMQGIYGVVAELISVPEGYEVAIETALGGALQNIICSDDTAAQAGIASLKQNKAGRLTFLPIRSIKGNNVREIGLKGAQGFKGFGVDCITFDPEYKNVMEYLLGRVIIVDNLENAIRLSKNASGGLRVVTLEGEIINAGGAITGGAYRNHTANLLERKSEIAKLEVQIEEIEAKKADGIKTLEHLRSIIEFEFDRISELDQEHRAAELELLNKENEMKAAESALSDFNHIHNKWKNELDSIENEQQSADQMVAALNDAIAAAKADIAATTASTEAALSEHDALKSQMESGSEEITKARIAASSCESEKSNVDKASARISAAIEEFSEEKKKREEALRRIIADREAILFGDNGSPESLKQKEEEKISIERYLEELTEERTAVTRTLSESLQAKDLLDEKLNAYQEQKYELEIKRAKNETQLESYKDKLWEEFEISYIQAIEFKKKDFAMAPAVKESREIRTRIKELGEVNVGAIKEYETVGERYTFLKSQRADILEAMGSLKQIIDDMDKTIKARFKESFDQVVSNFEMIFRELFGGGNAQLRLEDESRPLESGIEIIAQPPGKKLQNINLMSGGEKTMTAIAMMFAVLKTKPTPFCILDEIEAALDDANIDRFAAYLKQFSGIQFALVTHQKAMMEHANVLYGVTMPEQGISKIISLKVEDDFEL